MSSRERIRPKVIYKMSQSLLFQRTEEYHENSLKRLFKEHYKPIMSSDVINKEWTTNMSESTLNQLRLHLSWTMGINTFEWDRRNLGEQTLQKLQKLKVLRSLIDDVIQLQLEKSRSVDWDYVLC